MNEVFTFIEKEALYGKGVGYVDIALLTSTILSKETKLWTLDKHLSKLAEKFQTNYQ